MSAAADEAADMMCCASCGTSSECDNIKLKNCTACKLVKYCSIKCQREHRSQHKKACKKRAAELREELLFKQPESTHLGDCPICFIPLPLDSEKLSINACCCKTICMGCSYANKLQEIEQSLDQKCPFCRTPCPRDVREAELMAKKRIEANDPVALLQMGIDRYEERDYGSTFEYYTKAAEVGNMLAHQKLGHMYREGEGVEKDMKKAIYHWEVAAIGGHPSARAVLGVIERSRGRHERAMKHFIIAVNQGLDGAVEQLKKGYKEGYVSKDDFGEALRAYQRAVDGTKTPQREAAERNPDFQRAMSGTN